MKPSSNDARCGGETPNRSASSPASATPASRMASNTPSSIAASSTWYRAKPSIAAHTGAAGGGLTSVNGRPVRAIVCDFFSSG
jgi:hypothetical protein